MIRFEDVGEHVVLVYSPEQSEPSWLDHKLDDEGQVTFSRTLTVQQTDIVNSAQKNTQDDFDEDDRRFVIGAVEGGYRRIRKDVLGLKYDLLIDGGIRLHKKTFVAERDISIFRRIDDLTDEPIIIGGERVDAIPVDEFVELLRRFPTSSELRLYSFSRVSRILSEYMPTMSNAELRLQDYLKRREARRGNGLKSAGARIGVVSEIELEKFTYLRSRFVEMMKEAESYSESAWQAAVADLFLLVFPQYLAVLHNVCVKERYSKEEKSTDRYIDLMLVGANGSVDIIEIKKPFERALVSKRQYRNNHVPVRELSGSIMQAEKYLFYLSKSGRDGELSITRKHAGELPPDLEVKITNPKAIILAGRDHNLSAQEKFDLEFVRRKYSNVVDVISYDDLLRRLDNVIASLMARTGAMGAPGAVAVDGEAQ